MHTSVVHLSDRELSRYKRVQDLLDQLHTEGPPTALLAPGSPRPRKGVIVFPGSFNPPTTAHVALLKQAHLYSRAHRYRGHDLHVYAAFSKLTVDKERVVRPLLLDRVILLTTLLKRRLPRTGVMLFNRGLYVEQAEAVRSSFSGVSRVLFLMGFDKVVQIFDPHYYKDRDASLRELFALAELLVAPRGKDGEQELQSLLQKPENKQFARYVRWLPFDSAYRDVSSTHVREGQNSAAHTIPHEVLQFMRDTRAYNPPIHLRDGAEFDVYGERIQELEALLRSLSPGR